MRSVFIRVKTDSQREEVLVKMEAEVRVMWPQAKEPLEPLETGRGKEAFFPRDFRESMSLVLDFWFPEL